MVITVEGLPPAVSREQLVDWLATIGVDANQVRSLQVERGGIHVEVYALNPNGKRFAIKDEVATHRISIPVTGYEWAEPEVILTEDGEKLHDFVRGNLKVDG